MHVKLANANADGQWHVVAVKHANLGYLDLTDMLS